MKVPIMFTPLRVVHLIALSVPLTVLFMVAFFCQIGVAIFRTCEKASSKTAIKLMLQWERGE